MPVESTKPPEALASTGWRRRSASALLVTDADGVLRALDWEDYEPRMKSCCACNMARWS